MPRVFDHHDLHAQADAEVRQVLFPRVAAGGDHAFDAPAAETAGHQDAVQAGQDALGVGFGHALGIDPVDVHLRALHVAGGLQSLRHGQVCVVQLHVFAHETDLHGLRSLFDLFDHGAPLGQIRLRRLQAQLAADDARKSLILQSQRRLVQHGQRQVLDDAVALDVAERRDLIEDGGVLDGLVHPQNQNIRRYPHALQLLDGMLGRFGFMFAGCLQIRYQCDVDKESVLPALLDGDLPGRFEEGSAFDVADRAADLGDDDVSVGVAAHVVDEFLDLVGDVRDGLDSASHVVAFAFLGDDAGVHLARGDVGVLVEVFVDEAFVVTQIQVRLRAVVRHVDLPVLIGAHRAGIHVDIGIHLLRRDFQAPLLQQTSQRGGGDALAQPGNDAAGHKDVFRHVVPPLHA